jgi:glyoxylase-like metal-dependent hydrolase (beta-lactamase superfamily II)
MREILPGIFQWSWPSPEKGFDFNGHAIIGPDGTVLIDPPLPSNSDFDWLDAHKPYTAILITNRDHERESESLRIRLKAPIFLPEQDSPLMTLQADRLFRDRDAMPGGLTAINIPDSKSPGESALWRDSDGGVLILGDALIGVPAGRLNLLSPDKFKDPARAREGIRVLLNVPFDHVLVGDGTSILRNGRREVEAFLSRPS